MKIIRLMSVIIGTCNKILSFSRADLINAEAREQRDERAILAIKKEIATLEHIMLIAEAISEDVTADSHGKCVAMLLFFASEALEDMLSRVATKKKMQGKILLYFKKANDLLNVEL